MRRRKAGAGSMATTSCPSSFKVSGSPTGSKSPPTPRPKPPPPDPSGHHQDSAIALVGVGVAGRTDVRPDAAGRAVAADHVKELMRREMGQFVETDQGNLSPLPVIDRAVELQVGELDLAAA